jgi:LysR family glycine cleavage system transcriptional activator
MHSLFRGPVLVSMLAFALSSTALIADDLKAGKLVRPFGEHFKTTVDTGYFLVYLEEAENEPKVIAFRDWLLAEYCRAG